MRYEQLELILKRWGREGTWLLTARQLHVLFPGETQRIFNKSVTRHLRVGLIRRVTTGVYLNACASIPEMAPLALIEHLRPWHFNYVSLRSALRLHQSEYDPQQPLEIMTTGRSQTFNTPVGVIEMTHTKRTGDLLSQGVLFHPDLGIRLATPERAGDDLNRVYGVKPS